MIFENDDKGKLPDGKEMGRFLAMMQRQIPVQHIMPMERIVSNEDAYVLTKLSNGRYSIKPNITHQGLLYYGNCDFESVKKGLKPRFYQKPEFGEELGHGDFLEYNVLLEQFKLLVETFPLYKLLNEGIEVSPRLTIRIGNPYSLASAYGLKTPFMNLTSDIDVAMFYATHRYNEDTQDFEGVKKGLGIVYTYVLPLQFGLIPGLSTLGKQVFYRTFFNKQFLLSLNINDDFNKNKLVSGFTFRHSQEGADFYGKMFKNGELLIPKDDFLLKKWKSYDKIIFRDALINNLKSNPHDDITENTRILEGRGFTVKEGSPKFVKEDLAGIDLLKIWEELCDDLVASEYVRNSAVDFLEQVPDMEKYKSYFNVNLYYER